MIFSSYIFLFIYLPLVLILYFGMSRFVSRKVQHGFLILASFVFYGYAARELEVSYLQYVGVLVSSILVNYSMASIMENTTKARIKKTAFAIGVVFNVCLLGYYKYFNFFIENINTVFDTYFIIRNIILPIGLSFFTFQQIAFLIGIHKREDKVPGFIDYSLFITFFPKMVSGPIIFAKEVMPQFQEDRNRFFNVDNFSAGLFIFAIGLFKKAVIANMLSEFSENAFFMPDRLSFGSAWLGSLSYTFQIFFDFSGYSDMAIGLGRMMNINLPVNFYSPYKSKSITEFWKRWHITLGKSLAILVYFPLGGNRKGLSRTCINLFMVFLVSGIWHGAAWTFIVWGVAHGIVRIFEKLFEKQLDKIPSFIRIFFTFLFVNAAWVLFNSSSFGGALTILKKMFVPDSFSFDGLAILASNTNIAYPDTLAIIYIAAVLLISGAIVFCYPKNSIDKYNEFKPTVKNAVITAVLFAVSVIHFSKVGAFIYFNF